MMTLIHMFHIQDIYFVANENTGDKNGNPLGFVDNDEEYEALMKERWTLYETYSNNEEDAGSYKYNPARAGDYILYEIDENGNYIEGGTGSNGYKIFDGTEEEAKKSDIKVSKKAETISLDDDETMTDLGWNKDGSIWSAYKEETYEGRTRRSLGKSFSRS